MTRPDVTLPWETYIKLEDRATLAEDRLRIIRHAVHIHKAGPLTWNIWRLRRWVRDVRAALRQDSEEVPEP